MTDGIYLWLMNTALGLLGLIVVAPVVWINKKLGR